MTHPARVVVVGGGISGLTTAYRLTGQPAGRRPHVVVVESEARLGGKILTQQVAGHPVDAGPDALLVRSPAMRQLLTDLGLTDDLVAPGRKGAFVWSSERLSPLPAVSASGLPRRVLPLVTSRLLSPRGLARAGLDLVLPGSQVDHDPSVGELVRPRLGDEVFERLVEPMLGGLHAGRADLLSAASAAPELAALAQQNRSLLLGLHRSRASAPSTGPALVTLRGGLSRLVTALRAGLADGEVHTGSSAVSVEPTSNGYLVTLVDGTGLFADSVVLATPAPVTARLLEPLTPDAARVLRQIPYADVASLTLVYPRDALSRPLDGTGFLVAPSDGHLLVGCSWLPAKWPHLSDDAVVLIRCMVGRYGDHRHTRLTDRELAEAVHAELVDAMRLRRPPHEAVVQRWPAAMPQYTVGHRARLDAVAAAVAGLPRLHLTGAAYRGVGIASCVADAGRTADAVAAELETADTEPRRPR